jgi:hypothetical protein
MSNRIGKLEIIGKYADEIIIKHHQAKDPSKYNKIFKLKANPYGCWFDEFETVK